MLVALLLLASALSATADGSNASLDVYATELFILPIDPQKMFGWTRQGLYEQQQKKKCFRVVPISTISRSKRSRWTPQRRNCRQS